MIPDFTGNYISAKTIKDGDIIEILDGGKIEYSEALQKDTFNIKVKYNDKVKTWSPNNKHGLLLQQVFGQDSDSWKGQKVQLMLIEDKMLIKPLKT
jgi:hypothetical protein